MRTVRSSIIVCVAALCAVTVLAAREAPTPDKLDVGAEVGPIFPAARAVGDYIITVDDTGALYDWVLPADATAIVDAQGDDEIGTITWPFEFTAYGATYAAGDPIDVNSNGSVHLDPGGPRTLWVNCGDIPSTIDGQWVAALGDDLVSDQVWSQVDGSEPDRVLTIGWVQSVEFSGGGMASQQVSFYETSNVIVTQATIQAPFEFSGDGVGGINAGDAVRGTELYCGAEGGTPSDDWDVEYVPSCPLHISVNGGQPVGLLDHTLELRVELQHVRRQSAVAAPRLSIRNERGETVLSREYPERTFAQWDVLRIDEELDASKLPAGRYAVVFELDGMSGWEAREQAFVVVD